MNFVLTISSLTAVFTPSGSSECGSVTDQSEVELSDQATESRPGLARSVGRIVSGLRCRINFAPADAANLRCFRTFNPKLQVGIVSALR